MRVFLLLLVPLVLLGIYFDGNAVFEYPLGSVDFLTSFGEINGIGIGLNSENFRFGFVFLKDIEAFSVFKSEEKLFILESESVWLLSSGKSMENFSLNTFTLKKTPPLARLALKLAALPRCKKEDSECQKKIEEISALLDTIFESSLLARRFSKIGSDYSLFSIDVKNLPKIGFMSHNGGYYAGFSETDGTNAFVLGFGWKEGFSTGLGISTNVGKIRADLLLTIGEFGIDASLGIEMDFGREGKGFALLSKSGVFLYLF